MPQSDHGRRRFGGVFLGGACAWEYLRQRRPRPIVPAHERQQQSRIRRRTRAPRATHRRTSPDRRDSEGRESRPASAPGIADGRALCLRAAQRPGPRARRSDDRQAQDHGAHCVSDKEPAHVTVRILEKEYFVSCPQDERADLLDSAEFLNKKMREIRDTGKVVGADRIAVMAALNMANELLRLRKLDTELQGAVSGRVKNMRERVETALQRTRQLDL